MSRAATQPIRVWLRGHTIKGRIALLHGFAGAIIIVVLWLNLVFWPLSHLGFDADPLTGTIQFVAPGSAAERAGVRAGDRIIRLYHQPWETLMALPNALPLVGAPDPEVPITIERQTQHQFMTITGVLIKQPPSLAFQSTKLAMLLLSVLCWLTGYLIGIVRRQDATSSALVACFWLALGGTLGLYYVALNISWPLHLFLEWCILAVLAPLAVYIHCWFPRRTITTQRIGVVRAILVLVSSIATLALLGVLFAWPSARLQLSLVLSTYIVPVAVLVAVVISAVLLSSTYHRQASAHVRRQVRLIAFACLLSATGWLLTVLLPIWLALPALVADQRTNLVLICIPLAYLAAGLTPDLYRLDRVVARVALHITVLTLLLGLCTVVSRQFNLSSTAGLFWTVVGCVACYRPMQRLVHRVLFLGSPNPQYSPLHRAATNLTTTLDQAALVQFLVAGVRETFQEPALAFYSGAQDPQKTLTRTAQERFSDLPVVLGPGALVNRLCQRGSITLSPELGQRVQNISLHAAEQQIVHHPGIVVWGPIRHADGALLGVLLLGLRGDMDPYRHDDLHELQRLLDAAALAFANSAAYSAQRDAEQTIRTLYGQLAEAQQATAAAIARELHDEIINVSVRLNIETLQRILTSTPDPRIRAELELALETEQNVVQALRMVCEHLHPIAIDDPYALSAVLRMQVERIRALWDGECRLQISNTHLPVAPRVQYETMQIVHEALMNAVKHAQRATEILVYLHYPQTAGGLIRISVCDNGQNAEPVGIKPGHWGIRSMLERARLVGGQLTIERNDSGGTTVLFAIAPADDDGGDSLL